MSVVPLLMFVSLMLVAASLLAFGHSLSKRDHHHADRLALLPLEDDDRPNPDPGKGTP